MISGKHKLFSLVLFFAVTSVVAQKSPSSENDLKKQAEKLFLKESYDEATPMYSQLLSLYPHEAIYNYRYGVCLLMSGKDKTGAATYLQAAAKVKETDADVNFYLGRSYMFMDHYNEAISAFTIFKKLGSTVKQNKLQPDIYIHNCENANQLRMDRKNVVVLNKTIVNRAAFFAAYDFTDAAGKLLTTPDRFLTSFDRTKMQNPVMFLAKDGETIYFASYGKKGEHGKDIYRIIKLPNGTWSEPMNLGNAINTDENEDYPYLDKDGRTLYFSSKGHNSVGGYDVFKSQYDFNSGKWSDPVNIGIPINTVDDDIFYMPSTKGETAVYSTAFECENDKIELRNIKLGDVVSNVAVISGSYISQDQVTRRDARITVVRTKDNGVVISVKTDRTGEYELVLPVGEEYMLVVEGGSYLPHAENFFIPAGKSIPAMEQKIVMNKDGDKEEMAMTNYFTPSAVDPTIASVEKPTQVSKSEFDLKDTATSKMQSITFEGKTLYVAPPAEKNLEPSSVAVSYPAQGKDDSQTDTNSETKNDQQVLQEPGMENEPSNADNKNENSIADEKKSEPAVSEKTSNAELVKMAFEDAQSVREEARNLREDAREKREESKSLDSVAQSQVKHANELLAGGDKEQSQQVFKESQDNSVQAEQKNKEAQSLEADAREKDVESETSYREAAQLMKEFKVDTNAVAYHTIKNTSKNKNSSSAKKDESVSESSHAAIASQLSDEADTLMLQSLEMNQRAENATDKTHKAFYDKKSKDLKKQSEDKKTAARRETALAIKEKEHPLAVNSSTTKSAENKSEKEEQKNNAQSSENKTEKNEPADQKESSKSSVDENKNDSKSTAVNEEHKTAEEKSSTGNVTEKNESVKKTESQSEKDKAVAETKSDTQNDSGNLKSENETQPVTKEEIKIDPLAKTHYNNYQLIISERKRTELDVKEIDAKLQYYQPKKDHDSLVTAKSELTQQSKKQEQAAEKELTMAKEIDPQIEEKIVGNKQLAQSNPSSGGLAVDNEQPKKKTDSEQATADKKEIVKQNNKAESKQQTGGNEQSQKKSDSKEVTTDEKKNETIEQNNLAENKQLPKDNKQQNEKADNTSTSIDNNQSENTDQKNNVATDQPVASSKEPEASNQPPAASSEVLDTTKPEYPKYVEVQKEILAKQTETVNLFVEGMQLNKKAVAMKTDEMKLRDQAEVTANKKEKAKLIEKADSLSMEGDIITNHSKEKLAVAQKNTSVVKELTAKSDKLKTALVVKETPQQTETVLAVDSKKEKSENKNPKPKEESKKQDTKEQKTDSKTKEQETTTALAVEKEKSNELKESTSIDNSSSNEKVTEEKQSTSDRKSEASDKQKSSPAQTTQQNNSRVNTASAEQPSSTIQQSNNSAINSGETKTENKASPSSTSTLNFENEISDAFTFSMTKGDAYSSSNPIPMDPALPAGLVFKVQIGAFRKPLPDNTFGNLQPLSGETSRPGWIRYCLGLFRTFEPANLLKKEVRTSGYPDAFVVAYYNGKRIPLYEAYTIISKASSTEKQTYSSVSEKEFNHLAKFEIKKSSYDSIPDADAKAFFGTVEKVPDGLVEYAVQVGVYKSSKVPNALGSLLPLNTEQMTSGLFRFTTGRFNNYSSADSMKRVAVGTGVKDAFIVIYRGGKKAGQSEAQKILSERNAISKTTTSPAATPSTSSSTVEVPAKKSEPSTQPTSVQPQDVIFKIQLGAFKENVPFNTVSSFLQIADKGISQETDARGLHIFYAGQFTDYNEALTAKAEIISKGVKDAFVVAFVKGKRTSATEVIKLLNVK